MAARSHRSIIVRMATDTHAALLSLFGGEANLHAVARAWHRTNLSGVADSLSQPPFASLSAVRTELGSLWVRLTRLLFASRQLPLGARPADGVLHRATLERMLFLPGCTGWQRGAACLAGPRHSIQREMLNRWHVQQSQRLRLRRDARCMETGDGHFLRMSLRHCAVRWSTDLYDKDSTHKLDLEALPAAASAELRAAHRSFDVVVSHQVFEHLARPSIGIANLNVFLKEGGKLLFSTPFLLLDQPTPRDFSRFTVANVHRLLSCGGFEPEEVRGLGDILSSIAYLSGVSVGELGEENLGGSCSGRSCAMHHYILVVAAATKRRDVNVSDVVACFA
ncbi:hypothetical protein AB1Y20_021715 [Prymnesium parvum]|uniref:Methyltransferase type 11 domain-containing protein n=1 Tax=Prymnesium parvum TaxID=97485 RepID=A0AB34JLE9_PRYPA